MLVVSDNSPISNFFLIGRLDILQSLYGTIVMPVRVLQELEELKMHGIDTSVIKQLNWISVVKPAENEIFQKLNAELDYAEASAISLAMEINAEVLLIDERKGTKIAKRYNISTIGVLGILLLAKQHRLIESVQSLLDAMIEKAHLWIDEELYLLILKEAKEIL
ncbi:DUF3368 domain-containing protein [Foetidibacter luteolus]|uniref:DUF3368 domain-containing protein n=1 Tax=Foetidibacter luteolus TaxID=2608880 RepID=UPI00129BC7E6|nr:DUF3368 domain-containing protein [Foetidibacter luteolus]